MNYDMYGLVAMLTAPIFLFLVFVAPIWLILHYRSKNKLNVGLKEEERQSLQSLADTAERLHERVKTLEAILDAEHPSWRRRHQGESS